jgi:uncharacterized protein YbjT (DUF2867 family)
VALLLSPLLVASGHEVTAVIRNAAHTHDVSAAGAPPLVADLAELTVEDMAKILAGQNAVVWSAGAGGGSPARTEAIDRDAAIRSMDAALLAGVDRYVMVSYFGAGHDHGVETSDSFFAYAEAKSAADDHLETSTLNWTILRPSALTDDPGTGSIDIGDGISATQVPRADVARVVVEVLDRSASFGAILTFNTGPTPIAEAVSGHER